MKMAALGFILLFSATVKRRYLGGDILNPLLGAVLGAVSMAAWFTVAAAGRWIGFS